ncbi:unnamed protein product [Protopolystoma xenopodis]|uniref:Uncharacterized protein n=1 Tax=Protopolystoma xenopodis TaxID=117903 RepID=A0A3S4ZW67_9PLAT|nr:unnamed protein product [Protopolystoma xenopodis]
MHHFWLPLLLKLIPLSSILPCQQSKVTDIAVSKSTTAIGPSMLAPSASEGEAHSPDLLTQSSTLLVTSHIEPPDLSCTKSAFDCPSSAGQPNCGPLRPNGNLERENWPSSGCLGSLHSESAQDGVQNSKSVFHT